MKHDFNIEEIKEAIRASSPTTAIYIGCDSAKETVIENNKRIQMVTYVTVVVLHIDGKHGAKVFKQLDRQRDYGSLKERLMNEVYHATNIAYELLDVIEDRPFELHLDINPNKNHKSSVAVKEAIGYVKGMLGLDPKLKPESFAALCVADKYT